MSKDTSQWFFRRTELSSGGWETLVDDSIENWEHTGLRVARLRQSETIDITTTGAEKLLVPLTGSFTVTYSHHGQKVTQELAGRASVFDGPTDVLYLSTSTTAKIEAISREGGRILAATAPTDVVFDNCYIPVEDVPVELRGSGASSRQVHNFGRKESLDAAKFIVVEVITPAENWSSYPPHKHDVEVPGEETRLEEIYYFESAPARNATPEASEDHAFGMFSTYSSEAGEIQIDSMVQTGDVALVPYGYHGPAVAAPGYDLYYLNVMAGPGPDRDWLISDDPAHAWVRQTWEGQEFDSRLPFSLDEGGKAS